MRCIAEAGTGKSGYGNDDFMLMMTTVMNIVIIMIMWIMIVINTKNVLRSKQSLLLKPGISFITN